MIINKATLIYVLLSISFLQAKETKSVYTGLWKGELDFQGTKRCIEVDISPVGLAELTARMRFCDGDEFYGSTQFQEIHYGLIFNFPLKEINSSNYCGSRLFASKGLDMQFRLSRFTTNDEKTCVLEEEIAVGNAIKVGSSQANLSYIVNGNSNLEFFSDSQKVFSTFNIQSLLYSSYPDGILTFHTTQWTDFSEFQTEIIVGKIEKKDQFVGWGTFLLWTSTSGLNNTPHIVHGKITGTYDALSQKLSARWNADSPGFLDLRAKFDIVGLKIPRSY